MRFLGVKKLFVGIVFLQTFCFNLTNAQSSGCLSSQNLSPQLSCNFFLDSFTVGQHEKWFSITPDSSVIKIAFDTSSIGSNAEILSLNFYDGSNGCINPILLDSVLIDSLGYFITLVNPNQTYFIKVSRSHVTSLEYFKVCLQQDNVICGEGKCIGDGLQTNKLPLNFFYEKCDIGLNYATDHHNFATRGIFGGQPNPQNFTISGIPATAIIDAAFVWWTLGLEFENALTYPNGSITIDGNNVIGTVLPFVGGNMGTINPQNGQLMSRGCWGNLGAVGFRADVLPFINAGGNGTYSIRLWDNMGSPPPPWRPDADGATLMVIYHDPTANFSGTLTIHDGMITQSGSGLLTEDVLYDAVCENVINARFFSQFSDLQNVGPTNYEVDNIPYPVVESFWDFEENAITLNPNQSNSNFEVSNNFDCYHWILSGTYYQCSPYTSIIASDQTICPGSGPVTLTANPYDPTLIYQWYENGVFIGSGSQIQVTPTFTNNYVLNVLLPVCNGNTLNYTTSITIVVNPAPDPAISGNNSMCAIFDNIYYLTGIIPGTIDWQIIPASAGSVLYSLNSTTANVSWTNVMGTAVVQAYGIDGNGCSFTTSFNVEPCCVDPVLIPTGTLVTQANIPTDVSQYFIPWGTTFNGTLNIITNASIYIYNDLFIDQNFTFDQCSVFIAPGKSIILHSGIMLECKNSYFTAMCDEMWNGIIAQDPGNYVQVLSSTFTQAENAILVDNGAVLEVNQSQFLSNHKGIVIRNYPGPGFYPVTIRQSKFGTSPSIPLFAPHLSEQMHKDIEIINVEQIRIGLANNMASKNYFTRSDYGIHAINSSLIVINADFREINFNPNNPFCLPCQCDPGTAICAYTNKKISTHFVKVGGIGNNFQPCNFLDNDFGLTVIGNYDYLVQKNNFRNHIGAISGYNAITKSIQISDQNIFRDFKIAVGLYNVPNSQILIDNNDFNTGFFLFPSAVGNTAIYLNHITPSNVRADITNNSIVRVQNGIYLINTGGNILNQQYLINIKYNTIGFQQLSSNNFGGITHYGVRLENSQFVTVSHNTINKPGNNPNAASIGYLRGVGLKTSGLSLVYENTFNRMAEGIWAYGNCSNSALLCNDFLRTFQGCKFEGPSGTADVDDQYLNTTPTGNTWALTPAGGFGLAGGINPQINWWYSGAGINIPSSNLLPLSTNGPLLGTQAQFTSNPTICNLLPALQPPIEERENKIGKIVRGEKIFTNNEIEFNSYDKLIAFNLIRSDSTWLNLGTPDDTTYQNFYSSCQNSCIGKFDLVNKKIIDEDFVSAITTNGSIITTNNWEYNTKRVNEIYLSYLLDSIKPSSSDTLELLAIAYENSTTGGPGVFAARAFLRLDVEDLNNGETRNSEIENTSSENNSEFSIYPNPNSGKFTLLYELGSNESARLEIYDIGGKLVYSKLISNENSMIDIDLELEEGVYIYQIFAGEVLKTDKIIVIRRE